MIDHPEHRRLRLPPGFALGIGMALISILVVSAASGQASADRAPDEPPTPGFVIVVHAENPLPSVGRNVLSRMFLKKIKRWDSEAWPNAPEVAAFDQLEASAVRDRFSRGIHGKSVNAIRTFWQRMIFSGRDVPPSQLANDDEMIDRIGRMPGAVGYVTDSALLPAGVRQIEVID